MYLLAVSQEDDFFEIHDAETCEDFKHKYDFVEVKYGKWLKKPQRQKVNGSIIHRPCLVCSICERKHFALVSYNYCPNCGAKMGSQL